tara:strand:- start:1555 stop:1818 length:264 start_codon:yes stop_codon:yes gene_type:complete
MVLKFDRYEWFDNPNKDKIQKRVKKRQEKAYRRKKNHLDSMNWELSDFYVDVLAGDRLSKTKRKKIINLKQNIDDVKEKILSLRGGK